MADPNPGDKSDSRNSKAFYMGVVEHIQQQEPRMLSAMLLCLHIAISGDMNHMAERGFMLAHLGFFLLWQPLIRSGQRYRSLSIFTLLITIIALGILFSPWLTALWLILLSGLISGRVLSPGKGRAVYGFALGLLVWNLLVQVLPVIANAAPLSHTIDRITYLTILLVLVCIAVVGRPKQTGGTVDYFQGISFTLLMLLMSMGSLLVFHYTELNYLSSMLLALGLVIGLIITMAIFWQGKNNDIGLSQIWINYLLNVGTPLELWLQRLIRYAESKKLKAEDFALIASEEFTQHNWIQGVRLTLGEQIIEQGKLSGEKVTIEASNLELTLFLPYSIGSSLSIHARLLGRVFAFLYISKLSDQQLAQQNHLKAIYETGSKLTHDIKNNLQSLQTLTAIIAEEDGDGPAALSLLQRQLPEISNRLQMTMDKLKAPTKQEDQRISFESWWDNLVSRFHGRNIDFQKSGLQNLTVYRETLDTIIENLIDNARYKRAKDPAVKIVVSASAEDDILILAVEDDGAPMSNAIADQLFKECVTSESGYGIGLYQSYRAANQAGYSLQLDSNNEGAVRLSLSIPMNAEI